MAHFDQLTDHNLCPVDFFINVNDLRRLYKVFVAMIS